ncbi:MAG: hypothetical protein AB7V27_09505 [Candidatus Binatia bacterium]
MKPSRVLALAIGVVVVGAAVLYWVELRQQAALWRDAKEVTDAHFDKDGGVATMRYEGIIDGPLEKVQDAVWAVERGDEYVANVKKAELLSQDGNTKTVLLQVQALNLPLQQYTMLFTLDTARHRVDFKTTKAQAADLEGSYQLERSPDGLRTKIVYQATSTDKIAVPFPAAVIESANRETFVNTVRGINKLLADSAPPAS